MSGVLARRLEKLERAMGASVGCNLADGIRTARERVQTMSPAELHVEQGARLASMQARHAIKPLRGLEHRMMRGLERVAACTRAGQ